jgi:predicted metal-dependent hydrolase
MSEKTVFIPPVGQVLLRKNPRSKRIKLYVKPNRQVIVSLPYLVRYREAERFAASHIPWILKQLTKYDHLLPTFEPGSVYYTKSHLVKITEKDGEKITVKTSGEVVSVFIPAGTDTNSKPFREIVEKVITEVYRREAKQYLPDRTAELAQQFGFRFNKVTVRNNRSNWGSCSGKNNISLNLNLMKLPGHLIDYIILHELAHTIVKNHGEKFYALLDKVTDGEARQLSKEIKGYSTYAY